MPPLESKFTRHVGGAFLGTAVSGYAIWTLATYAMGAPLVANLPRGGTLHGTWAVCLEIFLALMGLVLAIHSLREIKSP